MLGGFATQIHVCGHERCLWPKLTSFKRRDVRMQKRATNTDYTIKMGQLIKDHMAQEWDELVVGESLARQKRRRQLALLFHRPHRSLVIGPNRPGWLLPASVIHLKHLSVSMILF